MADLPAELRTLADSERRRLALLLCLLLATALVAITVYGLVVLPEPQCADLPAFVCEVLQR